jgi:hypothetical protein
MYRAAAFTARDLFDLALVATREPAALLRIRDVLAARRKVLLERLARNDPELREDFAALDVLEFRPSYDECVERVLSALAQMALLSPHRIEEERAPYRTTITVSPSVHLRRLLIRKGAIAVVYSPEVHTRSGSGDQHEANPLARFSMRTLRASMAAPRSRETEGLSQVQEPILGRTEAN